MLLVTGGAGFIGSNVVAEFNKAGRSDIAVNDILGTGEKWRNLAGRRLAEFVPVPELLRWLDGASSVPTVFAERIRWMG
jgi:ADP-L-glycero-D-manno-heptose 6-epimerase